MGRALEHQFRPDWAIPPGQTMIEQMEAKGLTELDLARQIWIPAKLVPQLLSGETVIDRELAIKLEGLLDLPMDFWLNLDRNYRATLNRIEAQKARRRSKVQANGKTHKPAIATAS